MYSFSSEYQFYCILVSPMGSYITQILLGSHVKNAQDFATECVYKGITKYTFCIDYCSQA